MSPSKDRSKDPSPFAWIFGTALAFVALGGITRAILDRRAEAHPQRARAAGQTSEDDSLAGHPS